MPEPRTAPASFDCPVVGSRTLFRTVEYLNLPIVQEKLADKTGKTNFYKLADFGMNGKLSPVFPGVPTFDQVAGRKTDTPSSLGSR